MFGVELKLLEWNEFWPWAEPLFADHRAELGQTQFPLDVDVEMVKDFVADGNAIIMGLLVDESLVGYCIWYITMSFESRGVVVGQQGPWYVSPQWRHHGGWLFRKSFAVLRERGVAQVSVHCAPQDAEKFGKFFSAMGGLEIAREWSIKMRKDDDHAGV
jgi:hypothetical protein